jgi:hypothetical protein
MDDQKLVYLECKACEGRPYPRKLLWELKRDYGVKDPATFVCLTCAEKGLRNRADFKAERARQKDRMRKLGWEKCDCGEWCHHGDHDDDILSMWE